jgi:hypothetical protein
MLTFVQARDRLAELDPARGLLRVLRGVGVGTSAVVVSLTGHVAANGVVPPMAMLGIAFLLATLCAWALSGVRWTVTSLAGVMLAAQSVFHLVFSADAAASGSHLTVSMLVGHVTASVVMVAVLCRGEALVWAVVEGLSLRVRQLLRPAASPPLATPRTLVALPPVAMPRCWRRSVRPRRGPPLASSLLPVSA